MVFTLAGIGIGFAISLVAGVIWGLIIGDVFQGIGEVAPKGLLTTAVVLVALNGVRAFGSSSSDPDVDRDP